MIKRKSLNQDEIAIIMAVLEEATKHGYTELEQKYGNIGTDRLLAVKSKLDKWYHKEVLHYRFDPDYGWIDPREDF